MLNVLPDLARARRSFTHRHLFVAFRIDRCRHSSDELTSEVIDRLAQACIHFSFGIQHVLYDLGYQKTDEIPRVEEAAPSTQLPESIREARKIVLDFSLRRDELNVESYDLLFEEKEVRYEEEGGIGG